MSERREKCFCKKTIFQFLETGDFSNKNRDTAPEGNHPRLGRGSPKAALIALVVSARVAVSRDAFREGKMERIV